LETIVNNKRLYEAMFLVDSAEAASDWEGINKLITTILERAGAEIVSMKKWDERKLAYTIKKQTRGTYILCYFRADGGKIRDIERDVRLSERIMRVLILKVEHLTEQDITKETPAIKLEKEGGQPAEAKMEKSEAKEPEVYEKTVEENKAEPEK
jgi:small subunit ribosomal protein S6